MFLFFSNRLGCLGSLAVSALVTRGLVYAHTRLVSPHPAYDAVRNRPAAGPPARR